MGETEETVKLADLIPFRRRRTLSRYVDDKAVQDFAQVAKDQGMGLDYGDPVARLAELTQDDSPPDEKRLAEIARLAGQHGDKPL